MAAAEAGRGQMANAQGQSDVEWHPGATEHGKQPRLVAHLSLIHI